VAPPVGRWVKQKGGVASITLTPFPVNVTGKGEKTTKGMFSEGLPKRNQCSDRDDTVIGRQLSVID